MAPDPDIPPPDNGTWHGSLKQLANLFFAHPLSLSYSFHLGQELRRRFDNRHNLKAYFAQAQAHPPDADLVVIAATVELTGN